MVRTEKILIPAADLGKNNPMPDIKNVSYIHAGFELTDRISDAERKYIGKGMIPTMLPYLTQDGYDREKRPREFDAAVVENSHIKATFLPELGGRLWSLFDKDKNRELLYVNPVFQPGNLGLRNAWFSGGVEFNAGIKGHNPLTCSPLHAVIDKTPDGDVLRLYEFERIRGVVYSVSAWVDGDSPVLYLRCRIENLSDDDKYMYWWSNIAIPEMKGTRILVPAKESFLSFYNADHYVVDKTAIPESDGTDVSYPSNIPTSRDFFYKIPDESRKWIAGVDESGNGLLQCSTDRLFGRKLFVWGMSQGGRHWNEWLSEKGSAYIEIQAGLANTQLEHIPMKAHETWEWVEAYTGLYGNPDDFHGDYNTAIGKAEEYLKNRIGDPRTLKFPSDDSVISSEFIAYGSDFGSLEESVRGKRISRTLGFPRVYSPETAMWRELLENNTFPCPPTGSEPVSYMTGKFWEKKLEGLGKQNWYSLLQLGVTRYALYACGKYDSPDAALDAFMKSDEMTPNPWALRNIAMLHKNEYKTPGKAVEFILAAQRMKPDCLPLCIETAAILTENGEDGKWLSIFDSLPGKIRENGRIRLMRAVALIHTGRLDEAAEIIRPGFEMPDIKEGEISVSKLWFELYRRIYAEERGVAYDPSDEKLAAAADEKYPLPASLDFRMH